MVETLVRCINCGRDGQAPIPAPPVSHAKTTKYTESREKRRYVELKATGTCVTCMKAKAMRGKVRCSECNNLIRRREAKLRNG